MEVVSLPAIVLPETVRSPATTSMPPPVAPLALRCTVLDVTVVAVEVFST